MDLGYETVDLFHVTGTIEQIEQSTYGNCYINDGAGNRIFVYGIYDANGNKYNTLADKPVAGDTVTLCSIIANYDDKGTSKPELKAAVLIGITRN